MITDMIILQLRKDKFRFENLISNRDICKIIKKGLSTLSYFSTLERNEAAAQFFTQNSYKIFLKICFPMLAFEPVTITEDPVEYVLELNDICSD